MIDRRSVLRALPAIALVPHAPRVAAQAGGAPLRIIVPYPPGGSSDRAARFVADALQPRLGSPVIVENVVGAGGRLAAQQIARMSSDANVLMMANPALIVVAPLVYRSNGYDPDKDFLPVSTVARYTLGLAVGTGLPVRTVTELVAWVMANPGKASFGVPASGSLPHFFAMMIGQAAGVEVTIVPYKGSAPLATDLVGGHVPVALDALDVMLPLHDGGKIRILATSGEQRDPPSLPTLRESGLDLVGVGWNTVFAKATMPAAQVERLSREIAALMATPAVRKAFTDAKIDPVSSDRAQTVAEIDAFKARWVPTIRRAGLQFE